MQTLISQSQTEAQVAANVAQLLPAVQGATTQGVMSSLNNMNKIIQARIESNQGLSSGDEISERYLWARAFGSWGEQKDHKGVSGFKSSTGGLVLGFDRPVSERVRAGVALTYARSRIESNSSQSPSSVDVDTYELVGYGSYNINPYTDVNVQLDVGTNRASSQRQVFGGGTAKADFNSLALHGGVGLGRLVPLSERTNLTGSVRMDYTRVRAQGYTESGAAITAANLRVDASTYEEFLVTTDAKLVHQLNDRNRLQANVTVGYDFLNEPSQTASTFVGGGPAFVTTGLDKSPWLWRAGLGWSHDNQKGMEFSLRYDAEGRTSGYLNSTVSARLRWLF